MIIYSIPYILFLLNIIIERYTNKNKKNIFLFYIVMIYLIFFSGLRYDVDHDYRNYLYYFKLIPNLTEYSFTSDDLVFEPVFQALVSLIKTFFSNEVIFLVVATLAITNYAYIFRKETYIPSAALLIYYSDAFIVREFTQIRFGMAVSFSLIAIYFYRQKNIKKYLFYSIISAFTHYVCFIIFALPFFIKKIKNKKQITILATVLLIISLSGILRPIMELAIHSQLSPERLLSYADTKNTAQANLFFVVIQYTILLISLYFVNSKDQKDFFYIKVYATSFFILCLVSEFDLMRRFSFVFSTALYLLYASFLEKNKLTPVIIIGFYFFALFLYSRLAIVEPYEYLSINF